ncbi:MAG: hypothetical protein ACJAQX_001258 [Polaribacter sp.]|jgi:hypothetical protein
MTVISSKSKNHLDTNYLDFMKLLKPIILIDIEFKINNELIFATNPIIPIKFPFD